MRRKQLGLGLSTGKLCFVNSVRFPGRPSRLRVTCLAARARPGCQCHLAAAAHWPVYVPDAHISRRTVIHSVRGWPCEVYFESRLHCRHSSCRVYFSVALIPPDTTEAPLPLRECFISWLFQYICGYFRRIITFSSQGLPITPPD